AQDIDKSDFEFLKKYTISADHAQKLASTPVQLSNGRISTFETFSKALLSRITNEHHLNKQLCTQVVMSIILCPEVWERVPLISQENEEVASLLGSGDKHLSYLSLFNGRGKYILSSYVDLAEDTHDHDRTTLDKEILALDAKVTLMLQLRQATLFPVFPLKGNHENRWYSPGETHMNFYDFSNFETIQQLFTTYLFDLKEGLETGNWHPADKALSQIHHYQNTYAAPLVINPVKLKIDRIYTSYEWSEYIAFAYITIALALLVIFLINTFSLLEDTSGLKKALCLSYFIVFVLQTLLIIIQGYIYDGRFWMSHAAFVGLFSWISASIGVVLSRKSCIGFIICMFFSGLLAIVAELRPNYLEIDNFIISEQLIASRAYLTIILCSASLLIISSLSSCVMMLIISGRRFIEDSNTRIKELLRMNLSFTSTGLILLLTALALRLYLIIDLTHFLYWLTSDESIWIVVALISYGMVFLLHRKAKRKQFFVKQSASVAALMAITSLTIILFN
ncbi:MAG: hypothetical protein ACRC9Q_02165, partial [Bacteroidales bacterium]